MTLMAYMTSAELRSRFLAFFREKGHTVVPSSSLVPANDPSLLFTNAGMVQFKDIFLGREEPSFLRATSSQRCVRAGGKHNDLENVGYTARHHTFFEMLGNFSFGDYFKREAIRYAWEFLTDVLAVPPERLWITVYEHDEETERVWLDEVGINSERFTRVGTKDNFWSMGDTGPCGPCTEIFYDHGEEIAGGPPGSPHADGDRYVEIWNLVFMQYDRAQDGRLVPLPKPSVDTGMGLERMAAVMQGVHNNYQIDLFQSLINAAATLAHTSDLTHSSLRVIADHIRSCSFLIADGVLPSNEGRGYVLRRIIRRAIRHGYKLGTHDAFFYKLVGPLCTVMGDAYPDLRKTQPSIERILLNEEERFAETLQQGMKILEECIRDLKGGEIPGHIVFQLYDTYGFPVDLTADVAREHRLAVDLEGFEKLMHEQRDRARAASQFSVRHAQDVDLGAHTEFTGYVHLVEESKILALQKGGKIVDQLHAGDEGIVVLDKTSFYAESGGQVGDRGEICAEGAVFEVTDTKKRGDGVVLHLGHLTSGTLAVGSLCRAMVDETLRRATALNHSATHLLHAALRRILGDHVTQKGSLVNAERLRFDFSHFEPLKPHQIAAIERLVNEQVRLNYEVTPEIMSKDEALAAGAIALFGEKYGDEVRVLRMGDFSTELCGGTHVTRAGDIGFFKIIAETGVAAGVRRIEALTGQAAIDWVEQNESFLQTLSERLKAGREMLDEKIQQLIEKNRSLEKELDRLKSKFASAAGADLASQAIEIKGTKVLAAQVEQSDAKSLRDLIDQLKNKLGSAAIVLAGVKDEKVNLIAGVTQDRIDQIKAGDMVNLVAMQVGGKGGGRPDLAQAGGSNPAMLPKALASVPEWVRQRLA